MATFHIHQKITAFANQYRIYEDKDGAPGALIGFAHQKRLAIKEQFLVYADESKQDISFTIKARSVLELAGAYDVEDAQGERLGTLRKQFKQSLINSTWHITAQSNDDTLFVCRERSAPLAILRRVWGFVPFIGDLPFMLKYHFDFTDPVLKTVVGGYAKTTLLRDHYQLTFEDGALENIDPRVLIAQGIALDALQSR